MYLKEIYNNFYSEMKMKNKELEKILNDINECVVDSGVSIKEIEEKTVVPLNKFIDNIKLCVEQIEKNSFINNRKKYGKKRY